MRAPIVDAEGSCLRAIGEHVPQLRELGIAVLFHEPGDVVAAAPAAGLALDRQGRDAEDPRACARGLSSEAFAALEFGVPDLQPVPARPATIAAAGPLRHDPLEAELAGVGEHDRAFGRQGFAEHDAVDAADESRKRI